MKHQSRDYMCGVAAIQNALECVGITKYSQGAIKRLCHVDPDEGTPEDEIMRGLLACGAQVDEASHNTVHEAVYWLQESTDCGSPAIICVDDEEHWVTVIGSLGSQFVVFDPARGQGLRLYSSKGLATRWRSRTKPFYYGIAVSK